MGRGIGLLALTLLLSPAGAAELRGQATEEEAVRAVVVGLFDGMRAGDTTAMRTAFHADARMYGASPRDSTITGGSVDGWIGAIGRAPAGRVLDEVLSDMVVHVDGPLASVWTYYDFFAGDTFSHCGYDAFVLLRGREGWKIVSVADSRRQDGCRRQRR